MKNQFRGWNWAAGAALGLAALGFCVWPALAQQQQRGGGGAGGRAPAAAPVRAPAAAPVRAPARAPERAPERAPARAPVVVDRSSHGSLRHVETHVVQRPVIVNRPVEDAGKSWNAVRSKNVGHSSPAAR